MVRICLFVFVNNFDTTTDSIICADCTKFYGCYLNLFTITPFCKTLITSTDFILKQNVTFSP